MKLQLLLTTRAAVKIERRDMLRNISVCLIVMIIAGIVIADEESKRKTVPMPEGFKGVFIGMSLPDFLKIRPQIHPGGLGPTHEQKIDITKPNQSLSEGVESDPIFGLSFLGMYSFENGKLKSLSLIWGGNIKNVRAYRSVFISSCKKRWGSNFQRRVIKLEPETEDEHLAPLLLWEKGNTIIATVCILEGDKNLKEGGFEIILFSKNDKEFITALAGEKVEGSVRDKLFEGIGIFP